MQERRETWGIGAAGIGPPTYEGGWMDKIAMVRDLVGGIAIVAAYVTAVLLLALIDVGMTLLLLRWSSKIKGFAQLPQPEVPLPKLPDDHKVVVVGGGIRKWD